MSTFGNFWFSFGNFAIFSYIWKLSATFTMSPCHHVIILWGLLFSLAACQFALISINHHKTASISINKQPASINFDEQQLALTSINHYQSASISTSINQQQSVSIRINYHQHQLKSISINNHQWSSIREALPYQNGWHFADFFIMETKP